MSYRPQQIRVHYRTATRGAIPDGRTVDIRDQAGGQAAVLLDERHCSHLLADRITRLSMHQVVHGHWRQKWTGADRMRGPAEGLMMAVSRWERVPGHMLPSGRVVVAIEEDGSCVWLVDEDECTQQAQNEMNDLLLRLAGDGLWLQCWIQRPPPPTTASPAPPLTVPGAPLTLK
ncbi:hypothetical protein AB0D74_48505 [Streptomyces sp. NPDC048278]|uniref:hypothetical protein n=1 Tax=Streptomyces sp. NPDC048278 TaxID=3155809 RepID=UPI0034139240